MLNSLSAAQRISAFFLLFTISGFSFYGCYSKQSTEPENPQTETILPDAENLEVEITSPNVNLADPLVISDKPEDVSMCNEINESIDKSQFSNARWGVFAVSLKDGRVVCSRDGRKLFNPASIQKTLTAIVALDKLGADFRWKTSILAESQIDADGNLNGDLILYGQGAPDFDSATMDNLISQLQARGLKKISGNVIGDESYFRGDTIGDGWTWNELQWYYGAEASALSFNDNQAFINVENGNPKTSTDYITVKMGKPSTDENINTASNTEASGIKRGLSDNEFYIWGNAKNFGARVAVHDPAKMAAKFLKEALEKKGISIDGNFASRDWKSEQTTDVSNLTELASVESKTLAEIVKKMNKHSVNLYAELLLRTIGKKFGAEVPGEIQRPQNVRGDDTSGALLIKNWLNQHHAATDELQIYDGSGLSRLDFVTPESFARAFIYAAQSPVGNVFSDSLPVAATDGTLGGRFGKAKGKIIAKTGTITYVNSLAGYAAGKTGETFAFAVIVNNETRKGVVGAIDKAVMILVGEKAEKETENQNKTGNNLNSNQENSFYNQSIINQ
ncbi:MAG: D-alanyl-D-alanine carboxypeptidase/D-alanyl-D-alanine-endopeptidase [Pyrinomonadaceae bacterium]